MKKKTTYITSIVLGIFPSAGGVYMINFAYKEWQDYFTHGGQYLLYGILSLVAGVIAVFFSASLLFIGDKAYIQKSVRICAFIFAIIFGLAGVLGFIIVGLALVYYFSAHSYAYIALGIALASALITLPTSAISYVFFRRVHQAGWLKSNPVKDSQPASK